MRGEPHHAAARQAARPPARRRDPGSAARVAGDSRAGRTSTPRRPQPARALVVTAPDRLRERLIGLPRTRLTSRCAQLRVPSTAAEQERASALALRLCARRVHAADQEAQTLEREIRRLINQLAPALLHEPGRRCDLRRPPAPRLVAPTDACAPRRPSPGSPAPRRSRPAPAKQSATDSTVAATARLNRALHTIVLTRRRNHPATIAYIERRTQEGKTTREAVRCLKRYLARHLYRLSRPPPHLLDKHRSIAARPAPPQSRGRRPLAPSSKAKRCEGAMGAAGIEPATSRV